MESTFGHDVDKCRSESQRWTPVRRTVIVSRGVRQWGRKSALETLAVYYSGVGSIGDFANIDLRGCSAFKFHTRTLATEARISKSSHGVLVCCGTG